MKLLYQNLNYDDGETYSGSKTLGKLTLDIIKEEQQGFEDIWESRLVQKNSYPFGVA